MGQQTVGEYLTRATMRPKVGGIVQQVRIEGLTYSPRGPTLKAALPAEGIFSTPAALLPCLWGILKLVNPRVNI